MGAVVRGHVDQLERGLDELEGALEDRLRLADQGDDGTVRLAARVDVEQTHAGNRRGRTRDRPVDALALSF